MTNDRPALEIEVTPAAISVGIDALYAFNLDRDDPARAVLNVLSASLSELGVRAVPTSTSAGFPVPGGR